MKNNRGIQCTCNEYKVNGFAMIDGEAKAFEFETPHRDARAAKQAVAEQYGCSVSQVLVNFQLRKHKFTIDCSYSDLVDLCGNFGVGITEKTDSNSEK